MVLQQKIPTPPAEATASFDYADIQEGTGYSIYNLIQAQVSGNTTYALSRNDLDSSISELSGNTGSGKTLDLDFDVTFNRPQNVKGIAYVNIPHGILSNPNATTGYLVAKVRKWDGTTETEIIEATSETLSAPGSSGTDQKVHNIPITIPLTHFKKGETFRLTIEGWYSGTTGIYCIPVDVNGSYGATFWDNRFLAAVSSTKCKLNLPFVLKV
jgi:hypothetical protein